MIFCVLSFLLCMFLLYVTVLLPVGVIKNTDDYAFAVSNLSKLLATFGHSSRPSC